MSPHLPTSPLRQYMSTIHIDRPFALSTHTASASGNTLKSTALKVEDASQWTEVARMNTSEILVLSSLKPPPTYNEYNMKKGVAACRPRTTVLPLMSFQTLHSHDITVHSESACTNWLAFCVSPTQKALSLTHITTSCCQPAARPCNDITCQSCSRPLPRSILRFTVWTRCTGHH